MASEPRMLVARPGEPLIVIPIEVDGEEVEWVFTSEEEADAALAGRAERDVQEALGLAGAWSDLDFDDMMDELDRIRHANPPSPPLER